MVLRMIIVVQENEMDRGGTSVVVAETVQSGVTPRSPGSRLKCSLSDQFAGRSHSQTLRVRRLQVSDVELKKQR